MVYDERMTAGSAGARPDGESGRPARAGARDTGSGYACRVTWTGNLGTGTSAYDAYSRSHDIAVDGKPPVRGSADRRYRGDPGRHNPEDLLVAAVSACHMLTYLALCARNGVAVLAYDDRAQGTLSARRGQHAFEEIMLSPTVTLSDAAHETLARRLHETAREQCIIANSCSMPIRHAVDIRIDSGEQHD
jgi:organic hydroperoxide reductase OsmC/OhrA